MKDKIFKLRQQGLGYKKIATLLEMNVNSVKSICRRNVTVESACRMCGSLLIHTKGKKKKQFCDDDCRMAYWKIHPCCKKTYQHYICSYCKKQFSIYGNVKRKYCCHACYINDRFKGRQHG